ncbi:MAG: iron(III) transport system substrate-binding protein [Gammaproteobacteria bacterium]|jgi:iron(III) transport system substrate-binding protein
MKVFWLCWCLLLGSNLSIAAEVNIYSARKEDLILPLLDKYTEQTGVEVNLVTGDADALIKRLELEGINSPADILLTVDVGRLHRAKELNLLASVESPLLNNAIPELYRDVEGFWFGLSIRSRVIVYSRDAVSSSQLSTYEALADPVWRNKICVSSSSNIYNQSLVSSLVFRLGEDNTEQWAEGLAANLARSPKGGDRDQIKAVSVGQCSLAIVNTYYLAGMLTSKIASEAEAAKKVDLFWPNQNDRGAHVNISGAGVTKSSLRKAEAIRLIEYLASEEAQSWYAENNHEYPVRSGVPVSAVLRQWGEFKSDKLALSKLGELNASAVKLMDRAGWK